MTTLLSSPEEADAPILPIFVPCVIDALLVFVCLHHMFIGLLCGII